MHMHPPGDGKTWTVDSGLDHGLDSLVPRPHLQKGKGSGELGPNPWACAEEFPRANQIAALALSCD